MVIDILTGVLIFMGLLFFFGGGLGLVRFPDFYTRMHAAGKADTLSTLLLVSGFALYHGHVLVEGYQTGVFEAWWEPATVILKMLAICVFIMLTSPTSTHALIEAGYKDGIEPQVDRDDYKEGIDQNR